MTAMGTGAMLRLKSTSSRKLVGASVASLVTQPAAPPTPARFFLVARSLMAAARRDHCCFDTAATASHGRGVTIEFLEDFTEEPPDYRTEVIEAAFDAERWRIATATVEDDDSVPNTYFRYSVWRREDVG